LSSAREASRGEAARCYAHQYGFCKASELRSLPRRKKTRITIMLDDGIIEHFQAEAEAKATGCAIMINAACERFQ